MRVLFLSMIKKLGYLFAGLIIFAALLISLSYVLSPFVERYHATIEAKLSEALNTKISFKKVSLSWHYYQPEIKLDQVILHQENSEFPNVEIEEAGIFFSPFKSILQKKLIPAGVMLKGTNLTLIETKTGLKIQGLPLLSTFKTKSASTNFQTTVLLGLLAIKQEIILHKIHLRYINDLNQTKLVSLYDFHINQFGEKHKIYGSASLEQVIPTSINFAIEFKGDISSIDALNAKAYFYVTGISLTQWFKNINFYDWRIKDGFGSAKIWISYYHHALQSIQSNIQINELRLYAQKNQSLHVINRLSGDIGWKRFGETQTIIGDDILIDLPNHLWPVTGFKLRLVQDQNKKWIPQFLQIEYLDLKDFLNFLSSTSTVFSNTLQQTLAKIQLQGNLLNTSFTFLGKLDELDKTLITSSLKNISFLPINNIPAIKNFSSDLKWDGKVGILQINSHDFIWQDPTFYHSLLFDQVNGKLIFQKNVTQGWSFQLDAFRLLNEDLSLNLNGLINLMQNELPLVDLNAQFTFEKANQISRYLPTKIISSELNKWLQSSILSGEVISANAKLKGKLADFPFDHENGIFQLNALIKNVDFKFSPNWPILSRVDGKLTFDKRELLIDINRAKLTNIAIQNIHAKLNDISHNQPQLLEINSNDIATDFANAIDVLRVSPLNQNFGKLFSSIKVEGPIILKLKLIIPLNEPNLTKVEGKIDFKNSLLHLLNDRLTISKLNGNFDFTENSIYGKNIVGQLFNKDLLLNFTTLKNAKNESQLIADFESKIEVKDLTDYFNIPAFVNLSGAANVLGKIVFSWGSPLQVQLNSNLLGINLSILNYFSKSANEPANFEALLTMDEQNPLRLKLTYNNLLAAALTFNSVNNNLKLLGANVVFNSNQVDYPVMSGLSIKGDFEKIDWDKIKNLLTEANQGNLTSKFSVRSVDLSTKTFSIFNQSITNANLSLNTKVSNWLIKISSDQISGRIELPSNFTNKSLIIANLDDLNLKTANMGSKDSFLKLDELPSLSLFSKNVTVNDLKLGQLTLKTLPASNGITFPLVKMTSSRLDLQVKGSWFKNEGTQFQGYAKSKKISELLSSLNINANNFLAKEGSLTFDLNWDNLPYSPSLATLNGKVSINLANGRIVNIGQAENATTDLGKMLSIFSLQTIPRRLNLDFSDIFEKGYSFDSIKANVELKQGNAFTKDFVIEGPLARVDLAGRIGLQNKDFDLLLTVKPYVGVTSVIPVAATFLFNPLVGAAALLANTVLSSKVANVTSYSYSVKGSWDNPIWKTL